MYISTSSYVFMTLGIAIYNYACLSVYIYIYNMCIFLFFERITNLGAEETALFAFKTPPRNSMCWLESVELPKRHRTPSCRANLKSGIPSLKLTYCWWRKSCTTKDDDYPIIFRVSYIPGGARFQPSTVGNWMVGLRSFFWGENSIFRGVRTVSFREDTFEKPQLFSGFWCPGVPHPKVEVSRHLRAVWDEKVCVFVMGTCTISHYGSMGLVHKNLHLALDLWFSCR